MFCGRLTKAAAQSANPSGDWIRADSHVALNAALAGTASVGRFFAGNAQPFEIKCIFSCNARLGDPSVAAQFQPFAGESRWLAR